MSRPGATSMICAAWSARGRAPLIQVPRYDMVCGCSRSMKMKERSSATALPLDQLCEFFDDQCAQFGAQRVQSGIRRPVGGRVRTARRDGYAVAVVGGAG